MQLQRLSAVRLSEDFCHRVESFGSDKATFEFVHRSPRWKTSPWAGPVLGRGLFTESSAAPAQPFPHILVEVEEYLLAWSRRGRGCRVRVERFQAPDGQSHHLLFAVHQLRVHPVPFANGESWPESHVVDVDVLMSVQRMVRRTAAGLRWPNHVRVDRRSLSRGVGRIDAPRPLRLELFWSPDDERWQVEAWELDLLDLGGGPRRLWCGWPGRHLVGEPFVAGSEAAAWDVAIARVAAQGGPG